MARQRGVRGRVRRAAALAPRAVNGRGGGRAALTSLSGEDMRSFKGLLVRFLRDERGTETLEWGLVAGLIVVGSIAAIQAIGPKVSALWNAADSEIPAAPAAP